jgi:hypothetical protein
MLKQMKAIKEHAVNTLAAGPCLIVILCTRWLTSPSVARNFSTAARLAT